MSIGSLPHCWIPVAAETFSGMALLRVRWFASCSKDAWGKRRYASDAVLYP